MATAVFNVLLNLALIPRWSFLGAAAATALSEALCFALLFAAFRAQVALRGLAAAAAPPLAAGALLAGALAVVTRLAPASPLALVLVAAGCVPLYAGALLATRAVGGPELAVLRALLPARSRVR